MDLENVEVTCPTCFEVFVVPAPPLEEVPAEVDYDCEVCCSPMVIAFDREGEAVTATACGLDE